MKTIGLLGGMSWESTLEYYRILNEGVNQQLGGLHSAKIIMHSVDFGPIEKLMQDGAWDTIGSILIGASQDLEKAGADFLLICTNTMHKLAEKIENSISIPLLHIADSTAEMLLNGKIEKVGLLGTAFTMEQNFYRKRLESRFGLEVIIPGKEQRKTVNNVIFSELCHGKIVKSSRKRYIGIIEQLAEAGAEGIILGCTEIGLLVKQDDVAVKLFDTTAIHAAKAVIMALDS